jgi:hypothetical protein
MKITFYSSQPIKDIAKDLSSADLSVCDGNDRLDCERTLRDSKRYGCALLPITAECMKACRKIEIEIRRAKS